MLLNIPEVWGCVEGHEVSVLTEELGNPGGLNIQACLFKERDA